MGSRPAKTDPALPHHPFLFGEDRFRLSFECAAIGMALVSREGHWLQANRSLCDLLGYTEAELLGLTLSDVTHPEDLGADSGLARDLLAGKVPNYQIEKRLYKKSRQKIWAVLSVSMAKHPDDDIHCFVLVVQDITGQKSRSNALERCSGENDDIYENAPCGYHSLDGDGLVVRINDTELRWLGYRRDEVVGRMKFQDFLTTASLDAFNATFPGSKEFGSIIGQEFEMVRKDGSVLDVLLNTTAIRDSDGRYLMSRSTTINIETRKLAERQAMELLDLNTKIVARAPVGIIVYAGSGECVLANQESASIVGGTVEDIMMHPFPDLRFWRETGLLESAHDALATGLSHRENVHVISETGRNLWLDCDLVPFNCKGHSRLLYIMSDVTAFRVAEFELGEAKRTAEQASQAKSEFLANMSHEIRTPMTAIMGFTSLLEEAPLENRERDYVAKIKISAAALLGVLNNVLDFSKIEAGRLELEHTTFSLQDVMRSIAVIVSANAAVKNLEVIYDMALDVPDGLAGDPLRLQQILLNLAGNAVKFTMTGEVVLAVRKASVRSDRVELEFLVRDTGIGIDPQARSRLFQAFSQTDASTTRKFGGSGLGLAICSRLVALMGGTIAVSSALGQGSEFRFTASFGEAPEAVERRRAFVGLEGLEVLVVDDNGTAREVLVRTCETFGWHVSVAASGREGLEALRLASAQLRPLDILLLDWRMPEMDGLEMLRLAKGDPEIKVPPVILMVTVSDTGEVRRQAGGMSIDGVLAKPATPSAVFDAIAQLRADGTTSPRRPKPRGMAGRLRGVRLLLVEDNEINRQVASTILRRADAVVETVNSGEGAIALLRETPDAFDAVLMDVQMPGMNGYEATRGIRGIPGLSGLPIIAMTANAMVSDREESRRAGMNDHLAKPIDIQEMFAVLRKAVGLAPDGEAPAEPLASVAVPEDPPGIDVHDGLSRAGGQADLYLHLLNDVASAHAADADRIASALETGDTKEALQLAHALKGLAANLAVNRVAVAAGALEGVLRSGVSERQSTLVSALAASVREAVDSIHYLESLAPGWVTPKGPAEDFEAAAVAIADLKVELRCNDTNALVTLDRLIPLMGRRGSRLEHVKAAVEALDFETALVELQRLTAIADVSS